MPDLALEGALQIVARHLLAGAAVAAAEEGWGDHVPDIGENDWQRIADLLPQLAPFPSAEDFTAAYDFLEKRADK